MIRNNPSSFDSAKKGQGLSQFDEKFFPREFSRRRVSIVARDLGAQPRSGESQLAISCCAGETEGECGLFHREPGEVMELHELPQERIVLGQAVEGLMEGKQVLGRGGGDTCGLVEIEVNAPSAPFLGDLTASSFDQNPSHSLGRRREEMASTVPLLGLFGIDQAEIRLVDQRGSLECLSGILAGKSLGG